MSRMKISNGCSISIRINGAIWSPRHPFGAALYALYRFIVFRLYEVNNEFGRRHEDNAKAMAEGKVALGEIKSDLRLLVGIMTK